MRRMLWTGLLIALPVIMPGARAAAQTSYPFLFSLYPGGLRRGETADVTLQGLHNYHGAYRVLVEGAGVAAEVVPPPGGWPKPDEKTKALPEVNEVRLKVTASADALLGAREVRVITPRGVSSVGLLVVGDEPEAREKEPNNDAAGAQEIPIPVTVNGRLQQGEDVDTFRFRAQAGEEVTFAVLCARLEDKIHDLQQHADPLVSLRDAQGRELASDDDDYRADPLLHYRFEKAGDYFLQVRDVNYAGNPHWVYRLTVTKRPWVTALLPLCAPPGASLDVAPVGYGLGGGTARLEIPAGTPPGPCLAQVATAAGRSNPVPVLVTDLPARTRPAVPPGNAPEPLAPPAAVSARLAKEGEVHRYRFAAKAGQGFAFEVWARRLDSRLDSVLAVRNAQGQSLVENDDAEGSPDSRMDWTAPADGDYVVEVRDLHGRGGEGFVYLLTARPSGPDFALRCDDDKMMPAPGGSGAWYMLVERRFGFAAPITVEARGLPPGVTAAPLVIPPNVGQGCLVLSCAPGAAAGAGLVEVVGTAVVNGPDGRSVTLARRAQPLTEIYMPGGGRGLYPVDTQVVAVADTADITVQASAGALTLAPGGTARLDVTITRTPGFTRSVTLDVYLRHLGTVYGNPLPPGVSLDEGASKTLLGENETQGWLVLKAAPDAPPVTDLPVAVLGQVSVNFVVKRSYAASPVRVTVSPKP